MSKKSVKIKLNRKGVKSLLRSKEMMQICKDQAYSAKSKLGDGYEVSYRVGKDRVNAEIAAVSKKAKRQNLISNSILKALR